MPIWGLFCQGFDRKRVWSGTPQAPPVDRVGVFQQPTSQQQGRHRRNGGLSTTHSVFGLISGGKPRREAESTFVFGLAGGKPHPPPGLSKPSPRQAWRQLLISTKLDGQDLGVTQLHRPAGASHAVLALANFNDSESAPSRKRALVRLDVVLEEGEALF